MAFRLYRSERSLCHNHSLKQRLAAQFFHDLYLELVTNLSVRRKNDDWHSCCAFRVHICGPKLTGSPLLPIKETVHFDAGQSHRQPAGGGSDIQ